jgi:hypothetical protein
MDQENKKVTMTAKLKIGEDGEEDDLVITGPQETDDINPLVIFYANKYYSSGTSVCNDGKYFDNLDINFNVTVNDKPEQKTLTVTPTINNEMPSGDWLRVKCDSDTKYYALTSSKNVVDASPAVIEGANENNDANNIDNENIDFTGSVVDMRNRTSNPESKLRFQNAITNLSNKVSPQPNPFNKPIPESKLRFQNAITKLSNKVSPLPKTFNKPRIMGLVEDEQKKEGGKRTRKATRKSVRKAYRKASRKGSRNGKRNRGTRKK